MGKSTLLRQFRKELGDRQPHSCICEGKFEERFAASEPFAALAECVNQLVGYVLSEEWKTDFVKGLYESLETEWELLTDILPALHRLEPYLGDSSISIRSQLLESK